MSTTTIRSSSDTSVGPPVPDSIQKLRNLRRAKQQAISDIPPIVPDQDKPNPEKAQQPHSSSDDDDDSFGPQLPSANTNEDDQEAIARLIAREESKGTSSESILGSDRANWISLALGGSAASESEITYNPKTFRRNVTTATVDKTWRESHSERTKRQADEMMGMSSNLKTPPSPIRKVNPVPLPDESSATRSPVLDLDADPRISEPSLLDAHLAKRAEKRQRTEDQKFDWKRDMGGQTKRIADTVNQAKELGGRFERGSKK